MDSEPDDAVDERGTVRWYGPGTPMREALKIEWPGPQDCLVCSQAIEPGSVGVQLPRLAAGQWQMSPSYTYFHFDHFIEMLGLDVPKRR